MLEFCFFFVFFYAERKQLIACSLFVLVNYKGAKSSELTSAVMLGNVSVGVSQRGEGADGPPG